MMNVANRGKKIFAGLLAVTMVLAAVAFIPKDADATDTSVIPNQVIYQEYSNATDYWKPESKTAPVKEGYVFGGWFKKVQESEKTDATETSDNNGVTTYYEPLTEVTGTAYAKFVPAQVLSVKAQNQSKVNAEYIANLNKNLEEGQEKDYFWVRVMTSLDSKNYAKIGFDIHLANKKQGLTKADGSPLETTKIYDAIMEDGKETSAKEIFGGVSEHVCVWQLSKIDTASNANKIIYVRPYWYTLDGTKVFGVAKYVHIEDEYLNYISVPVNLYNIEDVAAGRVDITYDYEGLELIDENPAKYLEVGRILPEMEVKHNASKKMISMVGNAVTVGEYNSTETIYANIRFKKPVTQQDVTLNFNMKPGQFCDWDENTSATDKVKVWDISYEVKPTTN